MKAPHCYLRLFQGFPSALSFDLFLDSHLIAKKLFYEDFTPYKPYFEKKYVLYVCPHQEKEPIASYTFTLQANKIYTLMLFPTSGVPDHLQFLLLEEPPKPIPENHFLARAINLSPYNAPLKLHFQEIKPLFKKCITGHYSSYLAFEPQIGVLELFDPVTTEILCTMPPYSFKTTRYYALYILGGIKDYPFKIIPAVEGISLGLFADTPSFNN